MKNITVLGTGLVGSAIVKDLAKDDFQIKAVDFNSLSLNKLETEVAGIQTIQIDLQKEGTVEDVIFDSDLVICAVPGFMGFQTLERIINAEKNVVDISFFAQDPFELDKSAKSKNVTAIVDCGVAPGLSNILAGYVAEKLDHIENFICYVGGLPKTRLWPYEYKAVFSPRDVLEEYIRPARFIEYGKEVVRPALSDPELMNFPGVGTLEAFNTDGLRSLARTMDAPFMKEKTLRYPGHIELMRVFRESGFFSDDPIDVDGQKVAPIALTSKLLFDHWKLHEGEEDLTIFQVIVQGEKDGKKLRYDYYLLDRFDTDGQITSMARTTGYTCTIVARQLLSGLFTQKGICPPEYIGKTRGCYEDLIVNYKKRNINLEEKITNLD